MAGGRLKPLAKGEEFTHVSGGWLGVRVSLVLIGFHAESLHTSDRQVMIYLYTGRSSTVVPHLPSLEAVQDLCKYRSNPRKHRLQHADYAGPTR